MLVLFHAEGEGFLGVVCGQHDGDGFSTLYLPLVDFPRLVVVRINSVDFRTFGMIGAVGDVDADNTGRPVGNENHSLEKMIHDVNHKFDDKGTLESKTSEGEE
jgi:hypothetical protein